MGLKAILTWLLPLLFKARAMRQARRQGTLVFLKALEGARLTLTGLIALFVILQLLSTGFLVMVSAGLWLLPLEFEIKLWIMLGLGSCLFFVPFLALTYFLSGKFWYRASGADQMVNDLLENKSHK